MCLYPKLIINPKYKPNKKNGYNAPAIQDNRTLYVPIGCQKCMECRSQKANQWRVRLQEEIRESKLARSFMTFTFSNEAIRDLTRAIAEENEGEIPDGYDLDNAIASMAVRRFTERWRKKYGTTVRHWLVTELGQGKHWKYQGTENLHLHGFIFCEKEQIEDIRDKWQYGFVYRGEYVNEKSINYMIKYVTKIDTLHPNYQSKIYCSNGIGANYLNRIDAKKNAYQKGKTKETYTTTRGSQINLPIYYRNKIYSESQREALWIEKLDKKERWVDKQRISIAHGYEAYDMAIRYARMKNKRLGYGGEQTLEEQQDYERTRRNLLNKKRRDIANIQSPQNQTLARHRQRETNKQSSKLTKWIQAMANRHGNDSNNSTNANATRMHNN